MPRVTDADIQRMRDQLFFEGPEEGRRLSRFWILLVLAAVIAAAGVVADSTATVIGAMIVAPLMTPILGTMLAIVLADRLNLLRSITYVVAGAFLVIGIGFLVGVAVAVPVDAETNAQVAARVAPRIIDLVAALATGAVGAFALTRSDVSDTLPGVAIAISLVPPLAVVGLTLESGAPEQAAGALLLFVTNVSAILLSGVVVMAIYHVYEHLPTAQAMTSHINRTGAVGAVVVMVILVMLPLAAISTKIGLATLDEMTVESTATGSRSELRAPSRRPTRPPSAQPWTCGACATRPSIWSSCRRASSCSLARDQQSSVERLGSSAHRPRCRHRHRRQPCPALRLRVT